MDAPLVRLRRPRCTSWCTPSTTPPAAATLTRAKGSRTRRSVSHHSPPITRVPCAPFQPPSFRCMNACVGPRSAGGGMPPRVRQPRSPRAVASTRVLLFNTREPPECSRRRPCRPRGARRPRLRLPAPAVRACQGPALHGQHVPGPRGRRRMRRQGISIRRPCDICCILQPLPPCRFLKKRTATTRPLTAPRCRPPCPATRNAPLDSW